VASPYSILEFAAELNAANEASRAANFSFVVYRDQLRLRVKGKVGICRSTFWYRQFK
jgi:hypothetical protein